MWKALAVIGSLLLAAYLASKSEAKGGSKVRVLEEGSAKTRPFLKALAPPTSQGAIRVSRSERPYWQQQGWERSNGRLQGWYRTPYGSFKGEITEGWEGLKLYIFDPPYQLKDSGHWACFRPQGGTKWWIHFVEPPIDIDAGILSVERLLREALSRRRS